MLTKEQLEIRRQGIGASEIGAVCGLSPWQTARDVWIAKRTAEEPKRTPEEAFVLARGNALEEVVADWYTSTYGESLVEGQTIVDLTVPAVATPDRIVVGSAGTILVEIKTISVDMARHWEDGPPDYVVAQCQWQMLVTGATRVYVVVSVGARPPSGRYAVDRDDEQIALLSEIGRRFWTDYVAAGVEPPLENPPIVLPAEGSVQTEALADYVRDYADAASDERDATARKDAAKLLIQTWMVEHEAQKARGSWGSATCVATTRVDTAACLDAMGVRIPQEIKDAHSKTSSYVRITPKGTR